jgi:hypothetical protein
MIVRPLLRHTTGSKESVCEMVVDTVPVGLVLVAREILMVD